MAITIQCKKLGLLIFLIGVLSETYCLAHMDSSQIDRRFRFKSCSHSFMDQVDQCMDPFLRHMTMLFQGRSKTTKFFYNAFQDYYCLKYESVLMCLTQALSACHAPEAMQYLRERLNAPWVPAVNVICGFNVPNSIEALKQFREQTGNQQHKHTESGAEAGYLPQTESSIMGKQTGSVQTDDQLNNKYDGDQFKQQKINTYSTTQTNGRTNAENEKVKDSDHLISSDTYSGKQTSLIKILQRVISQNGNKQRETQSTDGLFSSREEHKSIDIDNTVQLKQTFQADDSESHERMAPDPEQSSKLKQVVVHFDQKVVKPGNSMWKNNIGKLLFDKKKLN